MIDYKEITFEQIDKMNLSELNKYIASYGKVLLQRTQRILEATESIERTRALEFNQSALSHITKSIGIDNKPKLSENVEYKEFSSLIEARARLKNLVVSLRASGSTITGQKQLSTIRRNKVRAYLKNFGIEKQFSNKQLDILDEGFATMDHGKGNYESDEIIRGFNEVAEAGDTVDEIVEKIEAFINGFGFDFDEEIDKYF